MSAQLECRTDTGLASVLRVSVMRLRRRLAHERHPDNDLSLGKMGVLAHLLRHGPESIGALAANEHVQPPSMTRAVTQLEQDGLVLRRPDESDGRVVVVEITDAGRETVLADRRRRDRWLARRLADLTPAEREILRAAAPILERLSSS